MKEQLKIKSAHPRGNLEVLVKIVLGHPSNNPEIQSFFASKLDQIRSSLLKHQQGTIDYKFLIQCGLANDVNLAFDEMHHVLFDVCHV